MQGKGRFRLLAVEYSRAVLEFDKKCLDGLTAAARQVRLR